MGCIESTQSSNLQQVHSIPKQTIKIATINYCGIMNNPFQFYCEGQLREELKKISDLFLQTTALYYPQAKTDSKNFQWQCGKVDQKYRNRYSPFFILEAGYDKKNKKFMNKSQFQIKWKQKFNIQQLKNKQKINEFSPKDIEATKQYDLIMYHTLLRYVFPQKINDKLEELQKLQFNLYQKKLKPFFELSYLNEQRKLKMIQKYFNKVNADVFFVQQYSTQFLKRIIEKPEIQYYFQTDQKQDSLILVKKSKFKDHQKKDKNDLFKEIKELNNNTQNQQYYHNLITYGQKPSVLVIDNMIFIGAHLSSAEAKNKQQILKLKSHLHLFKQALQGKYEIVLAGDLNSFLEPYTQQFKFYPSRSSQLTTIKMRTFSQAQFKKANTSVKESKDKIISTLPLGQTSISYIDGKTPNQSSLVPSNNHPFDHFMVIASIKRPI